MRLSDEETGISEVCERCGHAVCRCRKVGSAAFVPFPTTEEGIRAVMAERDHYAQALKRIAEHPVISESKFLDDLCDWHCTATMVAQAKDALRGD